MKKVLLLSCFMLFFQSIFSQMKNLNFKKTESNQHFSLRTYNINKSPDLNEKFYLIKGRVPGKAEVGFIQPDPNGKYTFNSMLRFWSKRKYIKDNDEMILRIEANAIQIPKEYQGAKAVQSKINLNENELILVREYELAYNPYEKDSIRMVQLTYVKKLQEYRNETVIIDYFEIGKAANATKAYESLSSIIKLVTPVKPFYNKKWDVNSGMNIPFSTSSYPTNLGYVKYNNYTKEYDPYKIDLKPGNLTGGGINFGRHIYKNFWVNLGFYGYSAPSKTYDSLYKRGDYLGKVILYDTKFSAGSITSIKLNIEKRFFVAKSQSIDVLIGGSYNSPIYFSMTEKTTKNGPINEHRINYKENFGFEFGCKYRALFYKQRLALFVGWKSLFINYKYKNYTVNDVESDINKAPYFLNTLNQLNVSGIEILFGVGYQLF